MARHSVNFTIPERSLGNADVEFLVKRDSELLGRLWISKGTVVWVPKGARQGYEIGWQKFDELMRDNGKIKK